MNFRWLYYLLLIFSVSCRTKNSDSCIDCTSYELKAVLEGEEQTINEPEASKNKFRLKNFISFALYLEQPDYIPQFTNPIANELILKFKSIYKLCEIDAYGDLKAYETNADVINGKIENQEVNLRITDMVLYPSLLQFRKRDIPEESVAIDTLLNLKSPLKVPKKIEGLPKIENKFSLISNSSPIFVYFENFYIDLNQSLKELQTRNLLGKCFEGISF